METRQPLKIAVLTISDSRTEANDTSGDYLVAALQKAGHQLANRSIIKDCKYTMRALVSNWILDDHIEVIITSGGTGFTGRDSTPEALMPLFDKHIDGFGELFRAISYTEIGSSTIQSRAFAGLANGTLVFALPGSTHACETGWEKILSTQLNIDNRPCNFAELMPRFRET